MAPTQLGGSTPAEGGLGSAGKIFRGATAGGSKDSVLVVFTEGNAVVTMQFDAAKGDGAPDSVVKQAAKAQDDKIKANPPS